jgi:hypothetical protein
LRWVILTVCHSLLLVHHALATALTHFRIKMLRRARASCRVVFELRYETLPSLRKDSERYFSVRIRFDCDEATMHLIMNKHTGYRSQVQGTCAGRHARSIAGRLFRGTSSDPGLPCSMILNSLPNTDRQESNQLGSTYVGGMSLPLLFCVQCPPKSRHSGL